MIRTEPAAVAVDHSATEPPSGRHKWVGALLSIAVHGLLLAILALQVMSGNGSEPAIETLVQTDVSSGDVTVGEPVSIDLKPLMPAENTQKAAALALAADSLPTAGVDLALASSVGSGTGGDTGAGTGFLNLPRNAVQAGSFAAWTTPQGVDNLRRRFKPKGEPGDSPSPGELYYITIQIKLPKGDSMYSLGDLSGEVVGTDKYRQRIPQGIFLQDEEGNLVKPPRSGKIKVIRGTVEFIMAVPGAARLVEDTIEISSKELDESQTLTLTFE